MPPNARKNTLLFLLKGQHEADVYGGDVDQRAAVVLALRGVFSKFSKDERAAFISVNTALQNAETRVMEAERTLKEVTAKAHEADASQDTACRGLAEAMVLDGFNRFNPFKVLGMPSPSQVCQQTDVTEAATLRTLAEKVLARPDAKAGSKKAATAAIEATDAMIEADQARTHAASEHTAAILERDALQPEWKLALSNLRAALRYGDVREKTSEYRSVFGGLTPKKKKAVAPPTSPVS